MSAGVPPPPGTATHTQLRAWLKQHYPVLALEDPAGPLPSTGAALELGGPPRELFVEPGVGLVMREP